MASRDASTSFNPDNPLSGYVGHLSEPQQKALDDFRAKLAANGIAEQVVDGQPKPLSDADLLRWLRARNFQVEKSYEMYKAHVDWRKSVDLDNLYKNFPWERARSAAKKFYPQFFHKTDKTGHPVHIHRLGLIDLAKLYQVVSQQEEIQFLYLQNEMNVRERFPACTKVLKEQAQASGGNPDEVRHIETVTSIIDVSGVTVFQFWKVKDVVSQVITISDANYPETLNHTYVINAPSLFSTIWGYIKGWIDPRTASRVSILSTDYQKTLLENIPAENLPTFLGGTCECKDRTAGSCMDGEVGPWVH
ncbi:CRAL/TRIO domain-containing protein [Atractiella rhizophila]|nr:CRAL/TRIO domain-containing protein [Atractiella rhizophila]